MRNIAAHNSPEQNAILAQPIDWPFLYTAFVSWSDIYDDAAERIEAIKSEVRYWHKLLETKESNQ